MNASIAASKAAGRYSAYGATKAALRSFARSWTVELIDCKIRVNAISPGPIDTPGLRGYIRGLEQSDEQIRTSIVTTVPPGRMGNPDEVA